MGTSLFDTPPMPPLAAPIPHQNTVLGMPVAPQQAAALPAPPPPKPSFMDRISAYLMPQQGMAGLLAPDGLASARNQGLLATGLSLLGNARGQGYGNAPSFGQALAGGVQAGQQAFQGSAQQQVDGGMQAMQIAEYRRILQNRARIAQQYAPAPNETPGETAQRTRAMAAEFARAGDGEMLQKLGGANAELFKDPYLDAQLHGKEPVQVDLGGKKVLLNPYTWQPMGSADKTPEPMSPEERAFREQSQQLAQQAQADRVSQERFQRESGLTSEFHTTIKPISDASRALMTINSLAPAAQQGDGMAQNNLLMALIKLQHPTAVVRPGEMLRQEDARSLPQSVVAGWQHLATGGRLAPAQVQSVLKEAKQLEQQWRSQYAPLRAQYEARAKRAGVDPSLLENPFDALDATSTAAPAGGNSNRVKAVLGRP